MKSTIALALVAFFMSASALANPRSAKQEAEIDAEITAIDPSLVARAHAANDAADRADWPSAAENYKVVHAGAPHVVAITRRLGTAEARNGEWSAGVAHCREAVKEEPSAENEAALAMAIVSQRVTVPTDAHEAVMHARRAVDLAPDTEFAHVTLCEAALAAKDMMSLGECSKRLRAIAPKLPMTHIYASYADASLQDWDGAEHELDEARALGYDEKQYAKLHADVEAARELHKDPWFIVVIPPVLASWIGVMFVIFVLGMLFDDSASRTQSAFARRAHRVILRVAALAFWPSAILCTAIFGFIVFQIVWRFLWLTSAPRWVLAGVGAATLYILIATGRALFSRIEDSDFRTRIDLDEEGDLREALESAASNARVAIDEVWMTPGATIEAANRGKKNVVLIGAAALEGLTRRELMALVTCALATMSDSAVLERASLAALCDRLEARGFASAANPLWWFVRVYRMFFERISSGASRGAEARAEKIAKTSYGKTSLATAREHVDASADEIAERVTAAMRGALDGNHEDVKFYAVGEDAGEDAAWSLFSNRAELEDLMSEKLRTMIRDRAGFTVDHASSASSVARA